MKIEILLGAILGFIVFLAAGGINVVPILLVLGLLYFLAMSGAPVKELGRGRAGVVVGAKSDVTFNDIGGQKIAKRELMEALNFLKNFEDAKKLGIRPLKGILLAGPPGTGKTLLAKAAANYTDSVFIAASGSEFIEVYAGVGAQRVRELFTRARRLARDHKKNQAIVFIDEIEVLAGKRGAQVGHLEYDQTLNQLLVEMDGLRESDGVKVLVIAATNRPDLLDPAIQRPGRFDRTVVVDLPDKDGRLEILRLHLRNKPLAEGVDLETLAQESFGLSGAHLESMCNEAAIIALRKGKSQIGMEELREAMDKVIMGERLERRPSDDELRRVAVHEAGHAIVSEILRPGSVAQVTVAPRGVALGYVRNIPPEDSYLWTRESLEQEIGVLLAGATAEDVLLGDRSSGGANDIERALRLAKQVVLLGLSPLGIVDRETAPPDVLGKAAREIILGVQERIRRTVVKYRGTIETLANELVSLEAVPGDRVRQLLAEKPLQWKWRSAGKRRSRREQGFRG